MPFGVENIGGTLSYSLAEAVVILERLVSICVLLRCFQGRKHVNQKDYRFGAKKEAWASSALPIISRYCSCVSIIPAGTFKDHTP